MVYRVAVPATPVLVSAVEEFMQSVAHERAHSAELFIRLVDHMTDRMLSLFLVEPSQMIKLSGTQSKVIDFAVATAGKASHMLTRQIYKKMGNVELAPVAKNMQALYWPAGDDNEGHAQLAFPADEAFAREFIDLAGRAMNGEGSAHVDGISRVMDRLADDIIDNFFISNSAVVKIGFMTQKALDIGVDGTRRAVHAVNHKVLKGLDDDQLKGFMAHYAPVVRAE